MIPITQVGTRTAIERVQPVVAGPRLRLTDRERRPPERRPPARRRPRPRPAEGHVDLYC